MAWKRDLATLISRLENTQFPFASIQDEIAAILMGIGEIEGDINEPVRRHLEHHIRRLDSKHQRCMGAFAVFHALLVQQARKERSRP